MLDDKIITQNTPLTEVEENIHAKHIFTQDETIEISRELGRVCTLITTSENSRNKRNNIWLTFDGVTMIAKDWSRHSPVNYRAFVKRIRRGWSLPKALSTP